jgi:hypothetical protein
MIDYNKTLVGVLSQILPTHYEMKLTSKTETPCISYMELNNYSSTPGETLGYSRITYQVKVWANDIETLQAYALKIDRALQPYGWIRISSGELFDNQSTMMQKILTYEAFALEDY